MDGAPRSKRKFPAYTLKELEKFVSEGRGNNEMMQEIADRKAGRSVALVVPQIEGGKPVTKVGRM